MSWKELPTMEMAGENDAATSNSSQPTKRSGLIRRICSRCFKTSSTQKDSPTQKSFPFGPIRRTSNGSTASYDSSADSHESSHSTPSTASSSTYNGPEGKTLEVPIVTVLDPAGELIHGHGGEWGDFEERQPIGSGAGGFKTIRERMEMGRRARRGVPVPPEQQVN